MNFSWNRVKRPRLLDILGPETRPPLPPPQPQAHRYHAKGRTPRLRHLPTAPLPCDHPRTEGLKLALSLPEFSRHWVGAQQANSPNAPRLESTMLRYRPLGRTDTYLLDAITLAYGVSSLHYRNFRSGSGTRQQTWRNTQGDTDTRQRYTGDYTRVYARGEQGTEWEGEN